MRFFFRGAPQNGGFPLGVPSKANQTGGSPQKKRQAQMQFWSEVRPPATMCHSPLVNADTFSRSKTRQNQMGLSCPVWIPEIQDNLLGPVLKQAQNVKTKSFGQLRGGISAESKEGGLNHRYFQANHVCFLGVDCPFLSTIVLFKNRSFCFP